MITLAEKHINYAKTNYLVQTKNMMNESSMVGEI